MKVVKCKNNHYYDADEYGEKCPHCEEGVEPFVEEKSEIKEIYTEKYGGDKKTIKKRKKIQKLQEKEKKKRLKEIEKEQKKRDKIEGKSAEKPEKKVKEKKAKGKDLKAVSIADTNKPLVSDDPERTERRYDLEKTEVAENAGIVAEVDEKTEVSPSVNTVIDDDDEKTAVMWNSSNSSASTTDDDDEKTADMWNSSNTSASSTDDDDEKTAVIWNSSNSSSNGDDDDEKTMVL